MDEKLYIGILYVFLRVARDIVLVRLICLIRLTYFQMVKWIKNFDRGANLPSDAQSTRSFNDVLMQRISWVSGFPKRLAVCQKGQA